MPFYGLSYSFKLYHRLKNKSTIRGTFFFDKAGFFIYHNEIRSFRMLTKEEGDMPLIREKLVKITLLVVSLGAMAFGILRGEMGEVLRKAVTICLECIGIG